MDARGCAPSEERPQLVQGFLVRSSDRDVAGVRVKEVVGPRPAWAANVARAREGDAAEAVLHGLDEGVNVGVDVGVRAFVLHA